MPFAPSWTSAPRWRVLGTAAIRDPGFLEAACAAFPNRVALGLDARGGMLAVSGWAEATNVRATDLARRAGELPPHADQALRPRVGRQVPAEPAQAVEKPREIIGYRDVRVPGRPLSECMGPDREIGPEVLRCRDGNMKREPSYR